MRLTVSFGFILRVFAGDCSYYNIYFILVVLTIIGGSFLAFGKRRAEKTVLSKPQYNN